MTWDKLTAEQVSDAMKREAYDAIIWTANNRFNADGKLENVVTKERVSVAGLSYADFDPNVYPHFSRNSGTGELNHDKGYTTQLREYRESTDGFHYAKQMEDVTIPEILDHDGSVIRPALTIPYSTFNSNIVKTGTVTTEPAWPAAQGE